MWISLDLSHRMHSMRQQPKGHFRFVLALSIHFKPTTPLKSEHGEKGGICRGQTNIKPCTKMVGFPLSSCTDKKDSGGHYKWLFFCWRKYPAVSSVWQKQARKWHKIQVGLLNKCIIQLFFRKKIAPMCAYQPHMLAVARVHRPNRCS